MKPKIFSITILIFLTILVSNSFAEFTKTCKVKYRHVDGSFSQGYSLNVTFATGSELQKATGDWTSYNFITNYAVIWFGKGECAIVKIEQMCITGTVFEENALPLIGNITGYDKRGVFWEICHHRMCFGF